MEKFKKWLENYWYHYKIITLIAGFLVLSGALLLTSVLQKKDPDFVMVYAGEAYASPTQLAPLEPALSQLVGDLNGDGNENYAFRMIAIRTGEITSYDVNKEQELNYSFLDKAVRLYVIEDDFLTPRENFFHPLDDILPAEVLEGGLKKADGSVYAIPMQSLPIAGELDFDREGMYLALKTVMDIERHDDAALLAFEKAKDVLRYMVAGL